MGGVHMDGAPMGGPHMTSPHFAPGHAGHMRMHAGHDGRHDGHIHRRHGVVFGFDDDYGYGDCGYEYRRWQTTGSPYWRSRYYECAD